MAPWKEREEMPDKSDRQCRGRKTPNNAPLLPLYPALPGMTARQLWLHFALARGYYVRIVHWYHRNANRAFWNGPSAHKAGCWQVVTTVETADAVHLLAAP